MFAGTVGVILRGANQGCLTKEEAIKLLNKLKASEFRIHPNSNCSISCGINSKHETLNKPLLGLRGYRGRAHDT